MKIVYFSLLFLCIIPYRNNAMECDLESEPTLVSSKEIIYFKMPKCLNVTNISSLNLSDKDASELARIQSIHATNMKKIEEYMDLQIKKASKSRNLFERFLDVDAWYDYHPIYTHKLFYDDHMEYCILFSKIDFCKLFKTNIQEFFYNKAHVESLLSEIPGITIMSKSDIENTQKEIKEAGMKKGLQEIKDSLKKLHLNNESH